jgi:hypothetical protein
MEQKEESLYVYSGSSYSVCGAFCHNNFFPVHAMKAYRGEWGSAPLILNPALDALDGLVERNLRVLAGNLTPNSQLITSH